MRQISLSTAAARILRALSTPIAFSNNSGHFRSALRGRAVNTRGEPILMYTYPVVDLLLARNWHDCTVLEWGAGQSTLWWAQYARQVTSIEQNQAWVNHVQQQLRRQASSAKDEERAQVTYCESNERALDFARSLLVKFDVIIVDAQPRIEAAELSVELLKPDGIIIVDNSDLASIGEAAVRLHAHNFGRIDFYGYSPGAFYKQCTSIFFRTLRFWQTAEGVAAISKRSAAK